MTKGLRIFLTAVAALLGAGSSARADLLLCNRMSYVVETAIAIEDKGAAATRGWFRIDPGQCRVIFPGVADAGNLFVHARVPDVYGPAPLPQAGHADFCVAPNDFVITTAQTCARPGQKLARFAAVKPSAREQNLVANLAEEAEYTEEQARLAGIQRLLVIAGYDANPIDGIQGAKTEAALAQFIKDRKLAADAASAPSFFNALIEAAQHPDGAGFAWCNDTAQTVMAALGTEEKAGVVTRGWYRVEPGRCVRPDVRGQPARLYSFAEAVDADGIAVKRGEKVLAWGGDTMLCTRNVKFEIAEHQDCVARGLSSSGFAVVEMAGRASMTVRFK
jgi:uncharacterized membrane protein